MLITEVGKRMSHTSVLPFLGGLLLTFFFCACSKSPDSSAPAYTAEVWPGEDWKKIEPAEAGFDVAKLDELAAYVKGAGCVTRDGKMVYSWGPYKGALEIASASKPVLMMLLLKAVESGKIASLDSRVVEVEPRLATLNAALGHKDAAITWRHFITQTSCYGVEEQPGAAFDYNDYQVALFYDTLMQRVFKIAQPEDATEKVLIPLLTGPLECETSPGFILPPEGNIAGRMKFSPRDLCRVGLMVMRGGRWKDKQIIDAEMLRRSYTEPLPNSLPRTKGKKAEMLPGQRTVGGPENQEEHMGSYSSMWWINGTDEKGNRLWPDAPPDTIGAFGQGGPKALIIIPSQKMVVAWARGELPYQPLSKGGRVVINDALKLLMDALKR